MRRVVSPSVLVLVLAALAGCGAEPELSPPRGSVAVPDAAAPADRPVDGAAVVEVEPDPVAPRSLRCVSDATVEGDEAFPHVTRVFASFDDAGAGTVHVFRGAQFRLRTDGTWRDDVAVGGARDVAPEVEPARVAFAEAEVRGGARARALEPAVSLDVVRDGSFFFGVLAEGGAERPVTCWDEAEVFGSAWFGAVGGAFDAVLDGATSTCRDAAGEPARNRFPLAFVQETGIALCADLSGFVLNGDDHAGADLSGWWMDGALVNGGGLVHAKLSSASLAGAKLGAMSLWASTLSGTTDDATELPALATCETVESPWGGAITSCE